MEFSNKTVVITGGASGIGFALAALLSAKGAKVAIADLDADAVQTAAAHIGCLGMPCDVTDESRVQSLVTSVSEKLGEIDIYVSNAGVFHGQPDHAASATDDVWMRNWSVHVMAHVYAARALLPQMLKRGSGYFINVTSAAGLLNQIGDAAYSATKQAAVSFAESLAITHGDAGIGVSVVCPQYVATPLIGLQDADAQTRPGLLTAEQVAQSILKGVEAGQFRILPHPEVARFAEMRAQNHDGWIEGMQRLRAKSLAKLGAERVAELYRIL
ncbi:SDR family NAD(P)-dependent oxidoreductase [uncultured Roseobacter sp.]|uniref:SDR family NAD(P)-dependent oxidoreductase n=1 Tax=uncultured Roseobacter sp. TaxID=114847 RepID=UPI00262DA527|nr:SDR family NAD(P)-dependent oxidoreductase [uncultured Roseobacter sp.]